MGQKQSFQVGAKLIGLYCLVAVLYSLPSLGILPRVIVGAIDRSKGPNNLISILCSLASYSGILMCSRTILDQRRFIP